MWVWVVWFGVVGLLIALGCLDGCLACSRVLWFWCLDCLFGYSFVLGFGVCFWAFAGDCFCVPCGCDLLGITLRVMVVCVVCCVCL